MGCVIVQRAFAPPPLSSGVARRLRDHPRHRFGKTPKGQQISLLHFEAPYSVALSLDESHSTEATGDVEILPATRTAAELYARASAAQTRLEHDPLSVQQYSEAIRGMRSEANPDHFSTSRRQSCTVLLDGAQTGNRRLTILYSHGNGTDLASGYAGFRHLSKLLCCQLIAYDYTGYGLSQGTCGESGAYDAAEAALAYVVHVLKLPISDVLFVGRSLGSGPATELAIRYPTCAGLVILSGLASCAAVAGGYAECVARPIDLFCNERKMKRVRCPVLVIHGMADRVVPISHGERLEAALRESARAPFIEVGFFDGCGHDNISSHPDYFSMQVAFIARVLSIR